MHTQRIRLSSASAEEVIEVRSTANGDHYCHVRDIQHALEFDTLATYKVDGVSIEYLVDSDGSPGTTRLKHFPEKVIEVTLCEPAESDISEVSRVRPFTASCHSVSTARGIQDAVMVENVEVAENPSIFNPEEQHIAVQNYAQQEEPHRIVQEHDKDSRLPRAAEDATNMITHGPSMDIAIKFLEGKLDIKNTLDVDTVGHNVSNRFHSLSGADLQHLESFLRTKDHDVFGNLSKVITPDGRIKWVCMHHSNEGHLPVAKQDFLQLVTTTNSGFFQQNLRHLTLSLKDPKLATIIIGDLPSFPLMIELSLELNWNFNAAGLDWIVKRLNASSVVHLNLDLKDKAIFKPPKTRLLSMRKYQPLQQLYQNPRLQSFRLSGASRFGIRTSRLTDIPDSNLRTLHFRIRFDCKEDQEVLQSIIQKCPHLVDLQLGGVYQSEIHDTLAEAIGGLKKLEVLHLYGMEKSRSGGVIYNVLRRIQESGCALRELVLVNSMMDAIETMKLIKSCERTLEVLVLDLSVFQPLKLTSILPDFSGPALDDYQLLRNLTSLHFHVADELQSARRLSKTLETLSLTHLGLSQQNPQGIKNSLEGKSLLHHVNYGSLRSLFLSGFSGSCLDPLWESVKESEFSASAHRPLESLSLEFLSNCPDLANKLNRLALKSLWVIAEVGELGCEVNQLALDLDLSTLSNVALFRTKRSMYWYGSPLTERTLSKLDVGKYYEGLEKYIALGMDQDLTLRVGEMIGYKNKLDLSILSVLTYRVQH
ncbi:hypothetical protein KVV02_006313, partial [Mortierella alpina]